MGGLSDGGPRMPCHFSFFSAEVFLFFTLTKSLVTSMTKLILVNWLFEL